MLLKPKPKTVFDILSQFILSKYFLPANKKIFEKNILYQRSYGSVFRALTLCPLTSFFVTSVNSTDDETGVKHAWISDTCARKH